MRDCTTGRTAKRMKPSLRSRGAESGSTPRASQSGAPWTVPPRFAMGTWPHRRRSQLQQSISAAPASAHQGRCTSVPHVRHEQSVAIGIQRDHLSVLSPTRKGPLHVQRKNSQLARRRASRQETCRRRALRSVPDISSSAQTSRTDPHAEGCRQAEGIGPTRSAILIDRKIAAGNAIVVSFPPLRAHPDETEQRPRRCPNRELSQCKSQHGQNRALPVRSLAPSRR